MWVQSLGQKDSWEEEMAACFSILAGIMPWTEDAGDLQSMGLQRVWHDWACTHAKNTIITFYLLVYVDSILRRTWLNSSYRVFLIPEQFYDGYGLIHLKVWWRLEAASQTCPYNEYQSQISYDSSPEIRWHATYCHDNPSYCWRSTPNGYL